MQAGGERITIQGRVLDGEGEAVPDALLEIWQADANGFFHHQEDPHWENADPHFRGFGRADTSRRRPVHLPDDQAWPVPFDSRRSRRRTSTCAFFARGMLTHAYTRFYFSDEAEANANDQILNIVDPERRHTLILQRQGSSDPPVYVLDVKLQGKDETVFFDP